MKELKAKLKNLYEQLYDVSISIGQLIEMADLTSIGAYMSIKDSLVTQIEELLPNFKESDLEIFYDICMKIKQQEELNITVLTNLQSKIKAEINKTNKKSKVLNAYSNTELKQGNLLDYRQ